MEATPLEIGGVDDHVHLVFGVKPTHCLSDILREVKSASSGWVHREIQFRLFGWQEGYGAFAVSASGLAKVRAYVRNQEEHHSRRSFQEEYLNLLRRHGVAFDEKYLW